MLNDNDGKPQGNMLRYIDGIFIWSKTNKQQQ